MIFPTSCNGCCSMASSFVISCLKAVLVYDLLRSAQLLLLVINGVGFPDAVFELLCLQCLKFQFMSCFVSYVGVLAPVLPVWGTLRLVLPVTNAFLVIFMLFVGV